MGVRYFNKVEICSFCLLSSQRGASKISIVVFTTFEVSCGNFTQILGSLESNKKIKTKVDENENEYENKNTIPVSKQLSSIFAVWVLCTPLCTR